MTGQKIIENAISLLGYTAANGNLQQNARIAAKALVTVNQIYSDLWRICNDGDFVPLKTVHEEIKLPERAVNDVMPYGLAMLIAQSESDGDQQQLYAALYNRKRTSLSKRESIQDVLPRGVDS